MIEGLRLWLICLLLPVGPLVAYYKWKSKKMHRIWSSYPSVEHYLGLHGGNAMQENGIKCYKCGSREIWRYSHYIGIKKWGHLHQCHQCDTWLYRT